MTAPERIWLQDNGDFDAASEVTWCQHRIEDNDTEYVRADLAAVPAQVRVKPLDLSNAMKHAFISGRVSAGAASSFHADAWTEYDPTESAGYARILAAIEPQPDPRDEVIARLTQRLETAHNAVRSIERDEETARGMLSDRDAVIARLVEAVDALEMWDVARGYPVPYRIRDPLRTALAAAKAVQHD